MSQSPPTADFWKRKLAAFLHDSPDKVLRILDHEERARRIAGEVPPDEQSRKEADWAASAADRLPFPPSSTSKTELTCFRHPLGNPQGDSKIPLNENALPLGLAEQTSQTTRPKLNENDPRAAFIATWRFWRNWASSRHADFALYPAETRLPDHTIWNHLAVTSAMQGCMGGSLKEYWDAKNRGLPPPPTPDAPAFLLFTIGPVQDFITAARSARDLWSGSYLLSYLIGHVLKRVALDFGPDHVIFPNLCDQPIMDLLLRKDIWDRVTTAEDQPLFEAFGYYRDADGAANDDGRQRLLTPSLPNRFLAVLPCTMAEHRHRGPQFASLEAYAQHLAADLKKFLTTDIAGDVSREALAALGDRFDAARFALQTQRLLEIHWQLLPWPSDFAAAEALATLLPPDAPHAEYTPRAGLHTLLELCQHGADRRYLTPDSKPKNVASAWSAIYASAEWHLDGTKSNRGFSASTGGSLAPGKTNTKDSLNGRDEAVLIVEDQGDADTLSAGLQRTLGKGHLLKPGEVLGAATLIKRLWPFAHLCKRHAFIPAKLSMPNTRSIAAHEPWADDDGDGEQGEGERYFAILSLDGDSMGKWISGSKTPKLIDVLSPECAAVYRAAGADLQNRRPLSPSWHLQFAEALGNFSQHAVRRIIEAFDGRLLYAGGDDVLAMLPADTALACARALRLAFRGDPELNTTALGVPTLQRDPKRNKNILRSDRTTPLFALRADQPGLIRLAATATTRHGATAGLLDDPVNFPAIVPGPAADVSVGLAIAHYKSPLQDVVRAAQIAEKRAKNQLGRSAVAVSLFKRSGEITEWGCNWDGGGLALYDALFRTIADGGVSSKFPYRFVELLEPYLTATSSLATTTLQPAPDFDAVAIIQREFTHVLERQAVDNKSPSYAALALHTQADAPAPSLLTTHLKGIKTEAQRKLADARKDAAAWAKRPPSERHRLETTPSTNDYLTALIGLCQTVAFNERNLPKGQ